MRAHLEMGAPASRIALGLQSRDVSATAHRFRDGSWAGGRPFMSGHRVEPSTGLHALLTMALLCEEVRLFGFHGTVPRGSNHTPRRLPDRLL